MNKYNAIGWFEIPVEDLDRAEAFYQSVLGVELDRQPEQNGVVMSFFPMHEDKPGSPGALASGEQYSVAREATGVIVYFTAPDLDDALERVEENGGSVLVPKTDIGEYGYIAWVRDTEGNTVALHAAEATA